MHGVNCPDFRDRLMEAARGTLDDGGRRQLAAHLDECADCGREFDEQSALSEALRGLAAETAAAPDILQTRLLAEFDAAKSSRHRRTILRWLPIAAALAIAAFFTGRLLMETRRVEPRPVSAHVQAPPASSTVAHIADPVTNTVPASHPRSAGHRTPSTPPAANGETDQAFFQIPYTLPLAPDERTEIVRMDMPVAAMIAAGLPLDVADSGAHAQADVLVGEDGRARAIRLVSISTLE
jgi:hypothetical protein